MLSPKVGDTMVRVIPPVDGTPGFTQTGTVDRVSDETIELLVLADYMRRMRFRRRDGLDSSGTGSFVVPIIAAVDGGFAAREGPPSAQQAAIDRAFRALRMDPSQGREISALFLAGLGLSESHSQPALTFAAGVQWERSRSAASVRATKKRAFSDCCDALEMAAKAVEQGRPPVGSV